MLPENRFLEILIIGALALIVVGPKDLPILMRRVGQFVGKMRGMAAEFRASFDELARQSELDELRKEVEALRSTHDAAVSDIHASLDTPIGGAFGDATPSVMTPLSPPPPAPVDGADDLRPASVVQSEPAAPPAEKTARKSRAAAAKTPAKSAAKPASKARASAPAKPISTATASADKDS